MEIVCSAGPTLVIFNRNGRRVAERTFEESGGPLRAKLVRYDGRTRIVATAASYNWLLTLEPPTLSPLWVWALGLAGSSGALGAAWSRRRKRCGERILDRREVEEQLLESLLAFGHAGSSLRAMDRLRFYFVNWDRVAGQPDQDRRPVTELLRTFELAVIPDLIGLASLARRAKLPEALWRPLVPEAQNALSDATAVTNETSGFPPTQQRLRG